MSDLFKKLNALVVIPARLDSTRLPHKVMLCKDNKPLLWHVVDPIRRAGVNYIVATEDREIYDFCREYKINYAITPKLNSGTERVMWIYDNLKEKYDRYINYQSDLIAEPELFDYFYRHATDKVFSHDILSMYYRKESQNTPNEVKVVLDSSDYALYFSRADIPYNTPMKNIHIGIYSFPAEDLHYLYESLGHGTQNEDLEQIAWLSKSKIEMMQYNPREKIHQIDTIKDYNEWLGNSP